MLTRVTSQVYLVLTGDKLNGSTVGAHPVSSLFISARFTFI